MGRKNRRQVEIIADVPHEARKGCYEAWDHHSANLSRGSLGKYLEKCEAKGLLRNVGTLGRDFHVITQKGSKVLEEYPGYKKHETDAERERLESNLSRRLPPIVDWRAAGEI